MAYEVMLKYYDFNLMFEKDTYYGVHQFVIVIVQHYFSIAIV